MNPSTKIESYYTALQKICTLVHSSTRVTDILDVVVKESAEMLKAKGTIVRILNPLTNHLDAYAVYGLGEKYLAKGPISGYNLTLYKNNKVIVIKDIMNDCRIQYPKQAWEEGIRMILDFPLSFRDNVIGVFRIFFTEQKSVSKDELDFLISIAEQCAIAVHNATVLEDKQKQYDQLILQTEKLTALGRMAAGIAHEINNPLAGILLYGTNMIKKVPENSPLKEGLEVIIHETVRCRGIIQELLEFARVREPQKSLANMNAIIEKALSIIENELHLRHIQVNKNFTETLPGIYIDVNQMQQVFINLLLNAVEAIKEKGLISIRTFMDDDQKYQTITISDTGCGISPEYLNKIFEPFFSTKPKGTGLGLAVSFGIVRNHGGDIQVASQPGQGTCFTITIPFSQNANK